MLQEFYHQSKTTYLIDIGNTSVGLASYQNQNIELLETFYETASFIEWLDATCASNSDACFIMASVVPDTNKKIKALGIPNLYFLSYQDIPLSVEAFSDPQEIGIDRLLTAFAAYSKYQCACLVLDGGSAITLCSVSEDARYLGGVIVPGLEMATKALDTFTAKIPKVSLEKPSYLVGSSTAQAVTSGLVNGYTYLINGFIEAIKNESEVDLYVVSTGQGLDWIHDSILADSHQPHLVFEGIKALIKAL